jgi:aryl-alcohol dehydrogenase-like predicted oxidoreductase
MTAVESYELAPGYSISRVIRGGWQLAGGHGAIDRDRAVDDLIAAFDAGVFTFDCADIYTGVEELYGAMRARLIATRGAGAANRLRVHTKLVPDLSILRTIERGDVEAIIDRSLRRLRMERLDLVQFHWWDYAEPRWLDALRWLDDLRSQGKVRLIGGTNFDTSRVRDIIEAGIPLASMQVQYSVLDRRPENGLSVLCRAHRVGLLCYGSVAGGFLSDRWLGQPEPALPLANRSLVKYKLIIDDFGGWRLFQELLRALRRVADRHHCDVATVRVASRSIFRASPPSLSARPRAHISPPTSRPARSKCLTPTGRRSTRSPQSAEDRKARSTNSSATEAGGTARS